MAKIPVAEMLFLCEEHTLEWRVFVFQFFGVFFKIQLIVSEGGAHVKILSFDRNFRSTFAMFQMCWLSIMNHFISYQINFYKILFGIESFCPRTSHAFLMN